MTSRNFYNLALPVADHDHMQSARAVGTERIRVCSMSAERDGPVIMLTVRGRTSGAEMLAQARHDGFEIAGDVGGIGHDDMHVRQKIECRRIVGAGNQDQRPGFGDRREGVGNRRHIVAGGGTAADVERSFPVPWQGGEAGSSP